MDLSKVTGVDVGRKHKRRKGRGPGSGCGKTSSRGMGGASSRKGFSGNMHREGGQMPLIRRLPKRGFTNIFRVEFESINVRDLVGYGDESITPDQLKSHGVIKKRAKRVKVLGDGELTKALDVHAHAFSKSAREKIEAAGGTATVIEVEAAPAKTAETDSGGTGEGTGESA
ncbi:MAG: 50S ribosomal protein L15 [bacterium]|nr:50S ribosomal protein L15 [bacterium]